jgi:hypothetical protein
MKEKYQLEYPMHTTARLLFQKISTSTGLEQWFAEYVKVDGNTFIFGWSGIEQIALLTSLRENQYVRFDWKDDAEKSFFEFRIRIDELTSELELLVTDFAEKTDKDDSIELWDTQIANLKHILGLYNE